jgi:hypothetical protein
MPNKLDVKAIMSFEELQNFFSATHEFQVENLSKPDEKMYKITYTDEGPGYEHKWLD